jgi:hypothetical protein
MRLEWKGNGFNTGLAHDRAHNRRASSRRAQLVELPPELNFTPPPHTEGQAASTTAGTPAQLHLPSRPVTYAQSCPALTYPLLPPPDVSSLQPSTAAFVQLGLRCVRQPANAPADRFVGPQNANIEGKRGWQAGACMGGREGKDSGAGYFCLSLTLLFIRQCALAL